jgi:hypothetical protein
VCCSTNSRSAMISANTHSCYTHTVVDLSLVFLFIFIVFIGRRCRLPLTNTLNKDLLTSNCV